jgi:cytochrome oxidase Cu insertion factor (SCO1/SenC/PrrC family)
MSNSENGSRGRDWRVIVVALLAAALVFGGIVYKYTGDFTGFAKFGTSGQPGRN